VASGWALPARGVHRNQSDGTGRAVVAFYNECGTGKNWIKEGKDAIKWTRLSCRTFAANAVRLQLHALAYNLGNFMRTLAMPKVVEPWSLTSLTEKLIKIGAKVVRHELRDVSAEVAVSQLMFRDILMLIARLRAPPAPAGEVQGSNATNNDCRGARHHEGKATSFMRDEAGTRRFRCPRNRSRLGLLAMDAQKPDNGARLSRNPRKNFS